MATKKKQKLSFKFKIADIRIIRFFENSFENYGFTVEDIKKCELTYDLNLTISPEDEKISFVISATYFKTAEKENEKKELCGIETEYVFECANFKENFPSKKEGSVEIPDPFMKELLQIAFHGTRGMMAAQVNNPEYKKMFLPVIDISEVLNGLRDEQKKMNQNIQQ